MHRGHVRVGEPRGRARLAQEALAHGVVGRGLIAGAAGDAQHLQRDVALEVGVARAIDDAHAAGTDDLGQLEGAEARADGERQRQAR
ncbi:MAG: hypothetical protein U1F43_22930 [Myxococcota bacterium]